MGINNYFRLLTSLLTVATLTACQSALQKNVDVRAEKVSVNSSVEKELVSAAHSVSQSLALLARSTEQTHVPVLNTAPLVTPEGGMGGTADIDWTGPIEPLVHKLSELSGYRVKIFGNEPQIPIVVSITQNKAVIADILKNAGMQAGKRANLVVFPAQKVIELRYAQMG